MTVDSEVPRINLDNANGTTSDNSLDIKINKLLVSKEKLTKIEKITFLTSGFTHDNKDDFECFIVSHYKELEGLIKNMAPGAKIIFYHERKSFSFEVRLVKNILEIVESDPH